MKIYVDFDDCLCETGRFCSGLVQKLFGKRVPYEQMRFFSLRESFDLTEAEYQLLLREVHEPEALLSYEETPGASAALGEWIRGGHAVSVITGRPSETYEVSRMWLDRHGLQDAELFLLDKYGRENIDKRSRFTLEPEDLVRMGFDYAVEDSPLAFRLFERLPALRVMVFDRPWNRDAGFPAGCYRRCEDWESIRKAFRGDLRMTEG